MSPGAKFLGAQKSRKLKKFPPYINLKKIFRLRRPFTTFRYNYNRALILVSAPTFLKARNATDSRIPDNPGGEWQKYIESLPFLGMEADMQSYINIFEDFFKQAVGAMVGFTSSDSGSEL